MDERGAAFEKVQAVISEESLLERNSSNTGELVDLSTNGKAWPGE